MIEILFGESEAASMKAAKNKVVIGRTSGPVSVWMAGKKTASAEFGGKWVEGTSDEVICLAFLLDIGDIRESADSRYRKELICSLYRQNQWEQEDEADELEQGVDAYAKELLRLKAFLDDGEAVRIWYSDAPYSRCGFYNVCRLLQAYENEVSVVKLPEYKICENSITLWKNWGEVAAEEFAGFLPYEKKLSKEEVRMYAFFWNELVDDNSPLRAVVNGRVIGVSEDFYDNQIWKRLTAKPVKEARLIGDILGKSPLGVGDWWYAKRIEHYIRQGKILVVEDAKSAYARVICRKEEDSLTERFEFRNIEQSEAEQAVKIEQICFPPNEACSEKSMKERIAKAPELFLVAVDKTNGRIAGFLNGLATDERIFRDEFFTDVNLYQPDGKNVMLLGLDVLPEYRGRGLAREIVRQYGLREQANGRELLTLTCLDAKVGMYQKMGFVDQGISGSTWGGEKWHEMTKEL